MQKIVLGILAHVDAGKTTLSEALLYQSGAIRKIGRVDNKDAFLDTYEVERSRGITVFSKQAVFAVGDLQVTLLDTPGHVDFSAEMERTLQVLDYAILVISGADGVQGHTRTLWRLLKRYQIPTFLFVNKMDQPGTDKEKLMQELKENLSGNCVDFSGFSVDASGQYSVWEERNGCNAQVGGAELKNAFYEEIAMCSEDALEEYMDTGSVTHAHVKEMIRDRQLFPCFFGSALKLTGVEAFLEGMAKHITAPDYDERFSARVFKILREEGTRLTFMKITGGSLKARDVLKGNCRDANGETVEWEEKVNQIRIYSGEKFDAVSEVAAGSICAVTGLDYTKPGDGLGAERGEVLPLLEPVLNYRIILPEDCDTAVMLPRLREIEEEEPQLQIVWNEKLQEIHAKVMGEVQIEILQGMILERFGVEVTFGNGNIVYKETIADVVEGVGHFEPLRHYAEVHLIMEPLERGSGLQFATAVSEDELDRNWQRLILTHLEEKSHKGVLTGSDITDMKITIAAGRAHLKHTEGGDFRESTYRAVRQGLMQASNVLLEPYYEFRMELPERYIGRAMTDVERLHGKCELTESAEGMAVLIGKGPVSTMWNYQKEVTAYTRGEGHFFAELGGYEPCHNTDEVLEQIGYDPDSDLANPASSVFCAHGAGFVVPWDEVYDYMHLEKRLGMRGTKWAGKVPGSSGYGGGGYADGEYADGEYADGEYAGGENGTGGYIDGKSVGRRIQKTAESQEIWLGTEEIDAILDRATNANRRENERSNKWAKTKTSRGKQAPATPTVREYKPVVRRPEYLLVDGYNIIFAWDDLKELAQTTIDGARGKLQDILCNYQGIKKCEVIVVFDAYRVQGHKTEILDYHNIHIVYTKEAETADQYIEKFAHENSKKYDVTVATSDGLEQIIIRGQGCRLLSARELKEEVERCEKALRQDYLEKQAPGRNRLGEHMPDFTSAEEE